MAELIVEVSSIPRTEGIDAGGWKEEDEVCPTCSKQFDNRKQFRMDDGTIVHKTCPVYRRVNGRTSPRFSFGVENVYSK